MELLTIIEVTLIVATMCVFVVWKKKKFASTTRHIIIVVAILSIIALYLHPADEWTRLLDGALRAGIALSFVLVLWRRK
jgi:uncharacterized membrane protein YccC